MATDSNPQSATNQGTSAKQAAREVAGEAQATAKEIGKEAAQEVRSTAEYVREQARTSIEEGKNQIAAQVEGVARAFRKGSDELRKDDMERLAEQGEWLANRVEELRDYLRDRSLPDLMDDIRHMARNQPGLFVGGLFATGLLAARFLRSSESGHAGHHGGYGSGDSYRS